jgi:aspartyl/asparaginyl beta-hydroxylase (cupin superfamily)
MKYLSQSAVPTSRLLVSRAPCRDRGARRMRRRPLLALLCVLGLLLGGIPAEAKGKRRPGKAKRRGGAATAGGGAGVDAAVAAVLQRAAGGASLEASTDALRGLGGAAVEPALRGGLGDLLRGFGSVERDSGRRRQLEHAAVSSYRQAAALLAEPAAAAAAAGVATPSQIQSRRTTWLGAAAGLAKDLSGGCSDEVAFAAEVQAEYCALLRAGELGRAGELARLECALQLGQYLHFQSKHAAVLELLAGADGAGGLLADSAALSPAEGAGFRGPALALAAAQLRHLKRFDEAVARYTEALAVLPGGGEALEAQEGGLQAGLADSLLGAGRVVEARAVFERGAAAGWWRSALQRPGAAHAGPSGPLLPSRPWWDANGPEYRATTAALEGRWEAIRDEGLAALAGGPGGGFVPELGRYTKFEGGGWDHLVLYEHGFKDFENCGRAPVTCEVVEGLLGGRVGRNVLGQVKFSLMQPGIIVAPHCGPTDARIRLHLGLQVPDGLSFSVGGVAGGWAEGKVTVFDDSYEHEIEHAGDRPRLVLLLDSFHPALSDQEIAALRRPQVGERVVRRNLGVYGDVARAHGIAQDWAASDAELTDLF